MNTDRQSEFLYLNRDNRWADFRWHGLTLDIDGALRLDSLPWFGIDRPSELKGLPTPDGPAGIAFGPDGSIYFSDPAGNRLLKIGGCDRRQDAVPCLGGTGGQPTQFRNPRGLLYHATRRALLIADSG